MTKNAQRLSQLISTFGPGAMIDLPTRSVVVGGLEEWDMKGNAFTTIPEPRLTMRLEQILKEQGRLDPAAHLSLRTPPTSIDARDGIPRGVAAPIFPTWFVCEQVETNTSGAKTTRRRRLVRWQDLDSKGRRKFQFDDGRKSDVTPIRFVCACDKGHLQDIDWRWVVHGSGPPCLEPMWVEEKGTSADPADTSIVCGCGRRLSLQETFQPGRLGKCLGNRPWLLDRDPEGCGDKLKLLTRTATNTYFPQVHTVISLPTEEDELSQLVDELSGDLAGVQTVQDIAQAKRFNPKVSASLGPYSDSEIFDRLQRIRDGARTDATRSPKLSEFDTFASGRPEIGNNHPAAKLYAQTLPRHVWADPDATIDLAIEEGPEDSKGKTSKALYKLKGDKLTLCVSLPGSLCPGWPLPSSPGSASSRTCCSTGRISMASAFCCPFLRDGTGSTMPACSTSGSTGLSRSACSLRCSRASWAERLEPGRERRQGVAGRSHRWYFSACTLWDAA